MKKEEKISKEAFKAYEAKATQFYLPKVFDGSDIKEDLNLVSFVKRFFTKLHNNEAINVQLLVNHEITLYNCFENTYITTYQFYKIENKHQTYLKTILIYLGLIPTNHILFRDVPFSFDFDYLLKDKTF